MFCARLPVAERQESLGWVLGALWRKGGEGWGAAQRPRCVTPWKGYALTSAPHCPCSACLRFNHIQIFITIWIKPWFFFYVHSARELRRWCWGYIASRCGQAIRKGMQREHKLTLLFFFFFFPFFFLSGDGLKIAIKGFWHWFVFIYFILHLSSYSNLFCFGGRSLWILACRREKKKEN